MENRQNLNHKDLIKREIGEILELECGHNGYLKPREFDCYSKFLKKVGFIQEEKK